MEARRQESSSSWVSGRALPMAIIPSWPGLGSPALTIILKVRAGLPASSRL